MRLPGACTPPGRGPTWRSTAFAVAVLVLSGTPAEAQRALSIRGKSDLTFGTVLRGVPTSIAPLAPEAGSWAVRGQPLAEVQISLTLPPNLINATAETMPVEFSGTDGAFGSHPQGADAQSFDPRLPLVTLIERSGGQIFVFLGGTALPSAVQAAGTYVAPITITVSYTGI